MIFNLFLCNIVKPLFNKNYLCKEKGKKKGKKSQRCLVCEVHRGLGGHLIRPLKPHFSIAS
jgi:hypothetical protein